jgi:hypothetical protein
VSLVTLGNQRAGPRRQTSMKRLSTLVLAFSMFVVACGSDAINEPAQQPAEPTPPSETELPLGSGPYPIGTIDVVVTNTHTGEQTASYSLSCLGDTATLTGDWSPADDDGGLGAAGDGMCRLLSEPVVQRRLVDGVPADQMCTEIYGSADVADVTGELDGQPVSTTFDRTNGCGIDDWDNVMAGLLPLPTNA